MSIFLERLSAGPLFTIFVSIAIRKHHNLYTLLATLYAKTNQFKAGHDKIVKEFEEDFAGRSVGFGTYDFGRPNGATHWIALSGKSKEDHMMMYDKLWKNETFVKLIKERGPAEEVKDYELKVLKQFQ